MSFDSGFSHSTLLAGGQGLHRGLEVPAAVLVTAGGHVYDVQFFVGQHIGQAVIGFNAYPRGCGVGAVFLHIADRYELGQLVRHMAIGMLIADATHPNYPNFQCHIRLSFREN